MVGLTYSVHYQATLALLALKLNMGIKTKENGFMKFGTKDIRNYIHMEKSLQMQRD